MAALVASGLALDSFVFAGFAPSRSNDRNSFLLGLADDDRGAVFFEAPHRIRKTLDAIGLLLVNRPIIICRELTKIHEEVIRISSAEAPGLTLTERGEFTVVIGPPEQTKEIPPSADDKDIYEVFSQSTNTSGRGRRQAIAKTAAHFGLSTNSVYAAIERFKASRPS